MTASLSRTIWTDQLTVPRFESKAGRRIILAFGAIGLGFGCSRDEGRVAVYRVDGQVSVLSQVPEGALVVLYPVGGTHPDLRPSAKVKADGSFQLTTYDSDDGAPAGDYVATLQWNKLVKKGNDYSAGPNLVPKTYAAQATSPWKIKVAAEPTKLPPLAITK